MELKHKPTVLLVTDWYAPAYKAGGPVRSVVNLVRLMEGQVHFRILAGDTDYASTSPLEGIQTESWVKGTFGEDIYFLRNQDLGIGTVRRIMDETPHDVLYIQGIFSKYFSIAPLLGRKSPTKTIVAVRGMLHRSALNTGGWKRWAKRLFLWIGRVLGIYNNVIFHSTGTKETLEIRNNFPMGNSLRIVEAGNVSDIVERKQFGRNKEKGKLKVLCLGRISEEKGSLILAEALKKVENVEITFAGGSHDASYFAKFNQTLSQLQGKAKYEGEWSREEVSARWGQFDIFASATLGENFGHAIAEALQSGLPVLVGDNTPWRNLAAKGCGFDIPAEANAFAEKLAVFRELDSAEMQKMSDAAHAFGKASIKEETLLNQYLHLFDTYVA